MKKRSTYLLYQDEVLKEEIKGEELARYTLVQRGGKESMRSHDHHEETKQTRKKRVIVEVHVED